MKHLTSNQQETKFHDLTHQLNHIPSYVIHLIQINPTQFTYNKSLAYSHMGGMVFELQNKPTTTLHNKLQQFPKM